MTLRWDITETEAAAYSAVHDDGMPFEYRFRKENGRWVNETNEELILGPTPAIFDTLEAARQWALRTEARHVSTAK